MPIDTATNEAVLIAGGEWSKLGMWRCDLASGEATQIFDYKGHLKSITSLSVSTDRGIVASGSEDGMVKLWSISKAISMLA